MTEKNTASNNSSLFIVIIPLALISIILIKTWKVIISIIFLGVGWRIWQQYEWQQFKQQVDPYFHSLMQDKRGNLTVADLAEAAQIPYPLASKYLLSKARQYGAELMSYGDDRDTYYFLTAKVIQEILADSEPETPAAKFIPPSPAEIAELLAAKVADSAIEHPITPVNSAIEASTPEKLEEKLDPAAPSTNLENTLGKSPSERGSIDYFPDTAT